MVMPGIPLTPEEQNRIEAAMKDAQRCTGARFSLLAVPMSDHYALYPPLWAALAALSIQGVVALFRPELSMRIGFLIGASAFIILTLLFGWLPIRLRIVPARVRLRHAKRLAHREFAVQVVADSRERNGILFFVSIGERYVEVLADRDIHERVGSQAWDKIVADFVEAARQKRFADGILAAIVALRALLEEHYPAMPRRE